MPAAVVSLTFEFQSGDTNTRLSRLTTALESAGYDISYSPSRNDLSQLKKAESMYKNVFGVENQTIQLVCTHGRTTFTLSAGWEVAVFSDDISTSMNSAGSFSKWITRALTADNPEVSESHYLVKRDEVRHIVRVVLTFGSGASLAAIGILGIALSLVIALMLILAAEVLLRE